MNPQAPETAGLNLPPPMRVPEAAPPTGPQSTPEAGPVARPEQGPQPGRQAPAAAAPMPSVPSVPAIPATPAAPMDPTITATTSSPLVADDHDLIEKEWVNKAKEIVERTRQNPYQQSNELNVFKADYMKKRYNKTLKVSE